MACATLGTTHAQEWLDRIDSSLGWQTHDGRVRADVSGTIDAETFYVDQLPPALIRPNDDVFFNPRLALFLDATAGDRWYAMAQMRADRGFDPGFRPDGDVRLDEYLLRFKPLGDARINLQAGKFATAFGNWVHRHDTWSNPLINAPLAYENMTPITDHLGPGGAAGFIGRKNVPDNKPAWLPVLWGPSYATGLSVFGALGKFDYALEFKNASVSSRPYAWDPFRQNWDATTWSGRIGHRPNAAWAYGASFSHGPYLLKFAEPTLPAGVGRHDFPQTTVGVDASWAWRRWQLWAEAIGSRFVVPNVGDADVFSYYLEAKYKATTRLFLAARWNQQLYGDVPDGTGGMQPWDHDAWRTDLAVGFRFTRHLQSKLQYSYNHQKGPRQQGEQLLAAQITLKF